MILWNRYVAKKVGIFIGGDQAIDGAELSTFSDEQLLARLGATTVFSRVSPEHKLKIVQLFQPLGKIEKCRIESA